MPRAMVAAGLPFVALFHHKVRTMPGERPAVVEGPDHGDIVLFDVAKQEGEVDVVPVEVVKVNKVGGKFSDFL